MDRATIDFGIDLGTTNSTIAMLKGMDVQVFKNNEGFEFTPSAVWIDKSNRLYVGRQAKERRESDYKNTFAEFKLQMGQDIDYVFQGSGRRMKPEELSAEVLKSLKADARKRLNEDIQSAVITVPAAFELPQCEATKRAAQLAGFKQSPLLQEPVAAALTYGFQTESKRSFWMIYDFGGGTFDAAVVQVRDNVIHVVNHDGDNHLGGKLIDWAIVEELLIPAVKKQYPLKDFGRHNEKWLSAIAKLKLHAEQAKIRVSADSSAQIFIEHLCQDDEGNPVEFDFELKREDVERLAEPFILRSINICKKVLSEKRLGAANIEKVILVGGPTLTPIFRERLTDKVEGLGIPLEFNVDPITVVARGAAIFAGSQKCDNPPRESVMEGQFSIELEYSPIGADIEPLVGGKVISPGKEDFTEFTIEFVNAESKPQWRSGKIGLSPEGTFMTNLWAEKGKENTFTIVLSDGKGTKCECQPDRFSYKVGVLFDEPPLIHSVGVGLANNEMQWFFKKGQSLPARQKRDLKTAITIRKGNTGDVIRIPVKEGSSERADRNREIGTLEIQEHEVKRDIPGGSEIRVTINIDRDRQMHVNAYIPFIDEEYANVLKLGYVEKDRNKVKEEFELEKKRLEQVRQKVEETGEEKALGKLRRIDEERMMHDVRSSLDAPSDDRDAVDKGEKRLLDLKMALDEAEESLEWPSLVMGAQKMLEAAQQTIREYGNSSDRAKLDGYLNEVNIAIETREPDILKQRMNDLSVFISRILDEKGILPVMYFNFMCEDREKIVDKNRASQLIVQGQQAINHNDFDSLRRINRELASLFPTPPPPPGISTVIR